MELDIKYQPQNALRYCYFDQCWVREIQMDGLWFCFYSKFQERLEDTQISQDLKGFKNINFPAQVLGVDKQHPKEFRGYIHICWSDHLPKSGGFMGLRHPPSFWIMMLLKPVGNDDSKMPVIYDIVK